MAGWVEGIRRALVLGPPLFFNAAIPLLYSSSLKGCPIVGIPSWIGWSIGRFGFVGIVPWPLMSNWCHCISGINGHFVKRVD